MTNKRKAIEDKLLKRIEDASDSEDIRWAVANFRDFATALDIEAEAKLREKEVKE